MDERVKKKDKCILEKRERVDKNLRDQRNKVNEYKNRPTRIRDAHRQKLKGKRIKICEISEKIIML